MLYCFISVALHDYKEHFYLRYHLSSNDVFLLSYFFNTMYDDCKVVPHLPCAPGYPPDPYWTRLASYASSSDP